MLIVSRLDQSLLKNKVEKLYDMIETNDEIGRLRKCFDLWMMMNKVSRERWVCTCVND